MKFLEKLIKWEKIFVSKVISDTKYLKILSLSLALIIFISTNGLGITGFDSFFSTAKYVDGIPLNVIVNENKIVTGLPETLGVNISGSSSDIKNLERNKTNINATINLTGHKDGSYPVKKEDIIFNQKYNLKITPLVQAYTVNIDTQKEMTMPVEVGYVNQDLAQSVILGESEIASPTVTFEVGAKMMEDVGSVRVLLDLNKISNGKNGSYTFDEIIKVYDNQGNLLDTHTTLPSVEVIQPYEVRTVKLPVKYDDINNESGEYVSNVCRNKITKNCIDEVEVYGDQNKINQLQYVSYNVNMEDYTKENSTVTAVPVLDDGIYIKGTSEYKVEIETEKGITKTFESVPIVIQKLDRTMETAPIANSTLDLTITGAETKIKNMTASDFMVYVDAKEITSKQTTTLPLQTNIEQTIDYNLSKTEIEIEFKEKK